MWNFTSAVMPGLMSVSAPESSVASTGKMSVSLPLGVIAAGAIFDTFAL
jgi:hypothetical protein